MAEEIAALVKPIAKAVQWIVFVIGIVAFLVFFALAPLHSLLLVELLIVLGSFAFGEKCPYI